MITLGFDPGGPGKFGCAAVDWKNGDLRAHSVDSVDDCLRFAQIVCTEKVPVFVYVCCIVSLLDRTAMVVPEPSPQLTLYVNEPAWSTDETSVAATVNSRR